MEADAKIAELRESIRAVARTGADDDASRLKVIERAEDLNLRGLVPDNWAADGALTEKRDTANDVFATLDGAVADFCADAEPFIPLWSVWVQDWCGSGDDGNPYTVIYTADGDLWACNFAYDDDGKVTLDPDTARKVRPCTQYIDRGKQRNKALRSHPRSVDPELRAVRDGMRGDREVRQMPSTGFEMREVPRDDGEGNWVVCAGYFSLSCSDVDDDSNAYEMEDAYGPWVESTVRGFATKTIREGCDTAFLVNHSGVTMARTKAGSLDLEERLDGGHYEGRLNPTRPDVQIIRAAVQDGAVDESSFAFRVVRQRWSDDYSRRWIQEIDMNKGDVSPVNYGANPHTGGHLSMRSAMALLASRAGLSERAWGMAMREIGELIAPELRAGKKVSQATRDVLEPIQEYLSDGSEHASSLADLLGLDAEASSGDGEGRSTVFIPDYSAHAKAALARARR